MSYRKIGSSSAAEQDLKRRRLLDAGGPVEDDEKARQKMRDAEVKEEAGGDIIGFDPDEKFCQKRYVDSISPATPMGYFAREGDLPMMRWLYVNGADTQKGLDTPLYFPMYSAAILSHYEVVKWLYTHGAAKDATRLIGGSGVWSPFKHLFLDGERSVYQWLILNGALCHDDDNESGLLDVETTKTNLGRASKFQRLREQFADTRQDLLEWAVGLHQTRTSFLTFLCGTLSRQGTCAVDPPLVSLGGSDGIMEPVADYLGVIRGREARIVRQLVELLPGICKEFEDIEDGWANESDGDSDSDRE